MNLKNYFFFVFFIVSIGVIGQDQTVVRVTPDPKYQDFRILFSSPQSQQVIVRLRSSTHHVLFEEDFGSTKGFVKGYRIDDLAFGSYLWEVEYGNRVHEEKFQLRPDGKSSRSSIDVSKDELLNLTIKVASVDEWPVNIFLFDLDGRQLEFLFWEPWEDEGRKTINLSKYDAYEVRLEILQQGDVVFDKVFETF